LWSQVVPSPLQQHGGQVALGVGLGLQVGFGMKVGVNGRAMSKASACSARVGLSPQPKNTRRALRACAWAQAARPAMA
jgi:hypothetical protein